MVGAGFEFRVILNAHKERLVRQLHCLHQPPIGGQPGEDQSRGGEGFPVVIVEFVAVSYTHLDVYKRQVQKYETGEIEVSIAVVNQIADLLDTTSTYILG